MAVKRSRSTVLRTLPALLALVALLAAGCGGRQGAAPGGAREPQQPAVEYPTKPVTMIIPWPAGSASDLAIRLISSYAEKELGVSINPVNMVGGNGAVAWAEVARAQPDGYTIGFFTFDVLTNQALGQTPTKYTDFDFLMQFTIQPMGFYVLASSPYATMQDLVNAALQRPGEITVATTALGGLFHQAAGLFEQASGAKFRYVPFQGSNEQMAALLGGHVDAMINTITLPHQHVQAGTVRFLAAMTEERLARYPDVPTLRELGWDVVYYSWRGIGLPKGVPQEIKDIILDAFTKAYNNPEFQQRAQEAGYDLMYRGPEEFTRFIAEQYPMVESALRYINMGGTK